MTARAISIPPDEAVYYEQTSSMLADRLAQLDNIEDILRIELSISFQFLVRAVRAKDRSRFPFPKSQWIAATFDCLSERDAFEYLVPLAGKRVLQIGGNGFSAILMLLAGAGDGCLLTPIIGEARIGRELARLAGVRLQTEVGMAEHMPFPDESFDAIHSSGCAHHFQTEIAFPEISRVLRKGGRFSATDPWRGPLYSWGIRTFGKREPVNCRPFTNERVAPLQLSFREYSVIQHGTFTRYPMLALQKLGFAAPLELAWRLMQIDDAVSSLTGLRSWGSSVAILATK